MHNGANRIMKGSSIHIYDYSTNVTKMQDKNWF